MIKYTRFLFLLFISIFSQNTISAQTSVVVGTGSVNSLYGPIYIFGATSTNTNSWNLSIYDQSEISAAGGFAGPISKISWNKTTTGGYLPQDATFEIFIKHTSQTDFPVAADFNNEVIGADLVYTNTLQSLPVNTGWIEFPLDNPFIWNGTDNIMILTRWQRVSAGTAAVNWQSTSYTPLYKTSHSFNTSSAMGTLYRAANRPNITLDFGSPSPIDAGVISIDSTSSHCAGGSYPVYATVRNFGTDPLNSLTLNWSLNSVPQTAIPYSGTINPSQTTQIFLGNLNYTSSSVYSISAYTSIPNGFNDTVNRNDTLTINNIRSSLSGMFTIGGTSPDFLTFSDACASLNTNGICGSVEFNLRNGTYTEQVSLVNIKGGSALNTITFQSESNDSSSVTITWPATTTATGNYLIRINNTSNLVFKNLTLERSGTDLFSNIIDLTGSDNCLFTNNRFIGPTSGNGTTNTTGTRSGIFSGSNTVNNNLIVRNNYFKDNANGIWVNGSTDQNAAGMVVDNNIFDTYYVGAFLLYQDAPVVSNNIITRNDIVSAIDYFGISLRYCTGPLFVSKNKITAYLGNYGIRLRDCTSQPGAEGLIVNNFVQVGGSAITRGISLEDNSNLQNIYHNSIHCNGIDLVTGNAVYIIGATTAGIQVYNNIMANSGGGYAYYVASNATGGILTSDFNDIYSSGTNIAFWGIARSNLFSLQASSTKDFSSVSGNPLFVSASDLHASAAILSHHALKIGGIPDDIDGDPRDWQTPDIGADEFTPVGIDELSDPSQLLAYPNPVSNLLTLKFDESINASNALIQITDITGRIVYNKELKSIHGTMEINLDVKNLKAGSYIIYCNSISGRINTRFIKL